MTTLSLIQMLQTFAHDYNKRVFSLREIATIANISRPAAGMTLIRAAKKGIVFRVGNFWINQMDPPDLNEIALNLTQPCYISFESALYHHHILSQSPRGALTVATQARPSLVETPQGNIRFTHLKPSLFFGYDANRIALPEKAWLDLIYIRGLQGNKGILTETFYMKTLNKKKLRLFQKEFPQWVAKYIDNLYQAVPMT